MAGLGLNPRPRSFEHPTTPPNNITTTTTTPSSRQLPRGPCNWRDLNHGSSASPCGCRQFWLNDAQLAHSGQQHRLSHVGAWCFCGHHACFHALRSDASFGVVNQQTEKQPDPSLNFPDIFGLDFAQPHANAPAGPSHAAGLPTAQELQNQWKPADFNASGLGLNLAGEDLPRVQHTHPSHLPQPHAIERAAAAHLPSTQSSPKPPSTYTSDADGRQRRSPNTNFMTQIARQRLKGPQVEVHNLPPASPREDAAAAAQSATEIATPSNAGTPALKQADDAFAAIRTTVDAFNKNFLPHNVNTTTSPTNNILAHAQRNNTAGNQSSSPSTVEQLMQQIAWLKNLLATTPNLGTSLLNLQSRVETLETVSFSHVPAEEIQDKFDHFDGRILELEGRLDDLEKMQAAQLEAASVKANESFTSNASISEEAAGPHPETRRISHSAALAHLTRLEERLNYLEATALPSLSAPWEVEVVFIPWGRGLTGVWCSPNEASQMSKYDSRASTAPYSANSTQPSATQPLGSNGLPFNAETTASHSREWTNGSSDWLSARACGPSRGTAGRVYERLKSRGFVRTAVVVDNSAQTVVATIVSAFANFGPAIGIMDDYTSSNIDASLGNFIGLQAPFVPLRKIHKSSRLQHLTEAELVTPALWTAEFLNSGVFMQAPTTGRRRLFITPPASYIQASTSYSWTWQKIRELPRFHPSAEEQPDMDIKVGEADANEPCWTWSARLDPPVSVHSSFGSNHSSLDSKPLSPQQTNEKSSGPPSETSRRFESNFEADQDESGEFEEPVEINSRHRSPITPTSELPSGRLYQDRRASSQPLTQVDLSPVVTVPKRQIASFDHASPVRNGPKRRRFSRNTDESDRINMWNLTPRRSREPISPRGRQLSSSRQANELHNENPTLGVSVKWGANSQAYATPYSGEIVMADGDVGIDHQAESGNDTDFDSDESEEQYSDDADDDDGSSRPIQDWRPAGFGDEEYEQDDEDDNDDDNDEEVWEGVDDDEQD